MFANIVLYSIGCFFILLMVSFAMKKCFSVMQSHLFIFALAVFASDIKLFPPKYWQDQYQRDYKLYLPLEV